MTQSSPDRSSDAPPAAFWLAPLVAAILRGIPYAVSRWGTAAGDGWRPPTGYLPRDFFSYAAFIRQAADHGQCLFADPYTTEAQGSRFILLFHWLLGLAAGVLQCEPMLVLELARIPLLFLFFYTVWRFTGALGFDRRERLWATALVGFSGGLEGLLAPYVAMGPEFVAERYHESVWGLYGWNTFQCLFNPLWIAGLTGTLWVLAAAIPRDRESFSWRRSGALFAGLVLLFFTHPYSALVAIAVLVANPIARWALQGDGDRRYLTCVGGAVAAALGFLACVARWQTQDPVYRMASNNLLGPLDLSVFWYPATLALVGVMALRTLHAWSEHRRPIFVFLVAWVATIILMHSSPILNGYHFVFHLHLPVAILAAPSVARFMTDVGGRPRLTPARGVAMAALFASAVLTTMNAIGDVGRQPTLSGDFPQILEELGREPPGRVLAPAELGNLIPAYTPHRVWVGHWFLTPDYLQRKRRYEDAVAANDSASLLALARQASADYLVVPRSCAFDLEQSTSYPTRASGEWALVELRERLASEAVKSARDSEPASEEPGSPG